MDDKVTIPLISQDGVTQVPVGEDFLAKLHELQYSMRQAEERGALRVTWVAGIDASRAEDL